MDLMDTARDKAEEWLNSEGRSPGHVAAGAAVCVAAAAITALIAWKRSPNAANPRINREFDRLDKSSLEPPKSAYSVLWPALFSVMTLSALRVWNAPSGPQRTRALSLWGGLQAINALWMFLRPTQRVAQVAAALTTFGATMLYAREVEKVDARSAKLIAPYAGWVGFANLLNGEVLRKNPPKTVH